MSFGMSKNNKNVLSVGDLGYSTKTYTPTISHDSYNVNIDLGLSWSPTANIATEFKSYDIKGYYAGQFLKKNVVSKSAYGFLYTGIDNSASSLLDFNREKDGSFDKNTKNLALTSFTNDIFSQFLPCIVLDINLYS